jgi:hypothetical protein
MRLTSEAQPFIGVEVWNKTRLRQTLCARTMGIQPTQGQIPVEEDRDSPTRRPLFLIGPQVHVSTSLCPAL